MSKLNEAELLWQECFGDELSWIKKYFSIFNAEKNLRYLCKDNIIASMLMTCKYKWNYYGEIIPFSYICGVCTKKEYGKQGLAQKLISQTIKQLYKEKEIFCGLIAANKSLLEFYNKYDFITCSNKEILLSDKNPLPMEDLPQFLEREQQQIFLNRVIHDKNTLGLYKKESYKQVDLSYNLNLQMYRIIDAKASLQLYARKNPKQKFIFRIKDNLIEENNCVFSIRDGKAEVLPLNNEATILTVSQLTKLIFKDATMFLMNDR